MSCLQQFGIYCTREPVHATRDKLNNINSTTTKCGRNSNSNNTRTGRSRLEEETLKPMCVNMRKLALLGKCFKQYFECQLSTSLAYEIVRSLFDEAIQKLGVDVCCNELSYRLIRYYAGTTFNDFVANQFRNMKHDVEMDRNLSKRLKILTNVKIVSSVTEKDHLSQVAGQCSGAGLEVEGR